MKQQKFECQCWKLLEFLLDELAEDDSRFFLRSPELDLKISTMCLFKSPPVFANSRLGQSAVLPYRTQESNVRRTLFFGMPPITYLQFEMTHLYNY